jgi:hypothetical protein
VSREEEDESVVPKEVIRMAERLAGKGEVGGLRLLVRMALLPLQAQAALHWTRPKEDKSGPFRRPSKWTKPSKGERRFLLDEVIPTEVLQALKQRGAGPLIQGGKIFVLDLGLHPAVSLPWNPDRVAWTLAWIGKRKWVYDPVNHRAYFYRPLGVGFFCGGMHSGMAGILKREGRLPATEVDLAPLYAAGLRVEWRRVGLFRRQEKPFAVVGKLARPMEHPHHALLLALGEVLYRHGVSL